MVPHLRTTAACLGFLCVTGLPGANAHAGVEHWQLNELHRSAGGDAQIRFVELVNSEGGCLFPTSTVELYDGDGQLVDTMSLTVSTTCHGAPTFLLLATPQAASYFGVSRDGNLSSELPSSGQLCFSSSATNYDCVRWGSVAAPVVDLFGAGDMSAALAPSDGFSLIRELTTHVVSADWNQGAATPRQPNDGTTWEPPDAGPVPDAGVIVDAGPPSDAARRSDAAPPPDARADAQDTRYLDLDAGGGAGCGCQSASGQSRAWLVLLALLLFRRRRRRQPPTACRSA